MELILNKKKNINKEKKLNEMKNRINNLNLSLKESIKDIKTSEEDLKDIDIEELKNILFSESKRQLQNEFIKKYLQEDNAEIKKMKEEKRKYNDMLLFISLLFPILIFSIFYLI